MPAINIPARIRFVLYLVAAVALILVDYFVDKGWAGAAEVGLVTKLGTIATAIAAAKTDLSEPNTRPMHRARDEAGHALMPEPPTALVVALVALILAATVVSLAASWPR